MAKTTIVGKVANLDAGTYKKDGVDVDRLFFSIGEWTPRKHPEGHPYAGKTHYNWFRCKAFQGTAKVLKDLGLKNGDWISVDVEISLDEYDRKDVPVVLSVNGKNVQYKALVPKYPTVECRVIDFKLVGDVNRESNPASTTTDLNMSEEQLLAALNSGGAEIVPMETEGADPVLAGAGKDTKAPF